MAATLPDAPPTLRPLRSTIAPLLAGAALLLAGLATALALLPETTVELPPRDAYARRFAELAAGHGATVGEQPHVELAWPEEERAAVRELLGEETSRWLAAHRRVLPVEVGQPVVWEDARGVLELDLGGDLAPWGARWMPSSAADLFTAAGRQPRDVCAPLLRPGERRGEPRAGGTFQQAPLTLIDLAGAAEPAHLAIQDPPGATVRCQRRPGSAREALAASRLGRAPVWPAVAGKLVWGAAVWVLLGILTLRRRVDFVAAGLLGAAVLLTTLVGAALAAGSARAVLLIAVAGAAVRALWAFVLWSTAESWLRGSLPGFTTSLDFLRRGRLGSRGGLALLRGWGAGAALAGLTMLALAAAEALPGVAPAQPLAHLPPWGLSGNPLASAVGWVATALLLYGLVVQVLPGAVAAVVAAGVTGWVAPAIELAPRWTEWMAASGLSLLLLVVFRRYGLSAALVAGLTGRALPALALAVLHSEWLAGSAVSLALLAAAPLVVGLVGVRRGEEMERHADAAPAFVRRLERERRVAYEMDLLAQLQTRLLPRSLPHLPGYQLTARSLIATEAGGDLYDFQWDDAGRLWLAAGDVSGHGYSCAIAQATVKAALLSLIGVDRSPAAVMSELDRVLRATLAEQQFVTLFLACLQPATGELRVASAGHPYAVLFHDGVVEEVQLPGLPLGRGPRRSYDERTLRLERGSVLLLYSDGLVEATNRRGEEYGYDRPLAVLRQAAQWNAAEILERLLFDWRGHLGAEPAADDTTLVVLKRR
jgi:serine phosphatase RsbU (regulator of sigma subunit)